MTYIIQRLNPITAEWSDYTEPFNLYQEALEALLDLRKSYIYSRWRLVRTITEKFIMPD